MLPHLPFDELQSMSKFHLLVLLSSKQVDLPIKKKISIVKLSQISLITKHHLQFVLHELFQTYAVNHVL